MFEIGKVYVAPEATHGSNWEAQTDDTRAEFAESRIFNRIEGCVGDLAH